MLGIDIIETKRIKNAITKYGSRFLTKIFTPNEINYCEQSKTNQKYQRYAARFAAKEAVAKVIKNGPEGYFWTEIEVSHHSSGAPMVNLSDRLNKLLDQKSIEISLSHCKDYATAVALLRS